MKTNNTAATGLDLLQVAFIVLKLFGVIKWSWWWVLSPVWITAVVVVVAILIKIIADRL